MPPEAKSDLGDRLDKYLARLHQLKERQSLREVTERELFLEFISINRQRINEFPLLPTQQQSIIDNLSYRSASHPAHQYVKRFISSYVAILNQLDKSDPASESPERKQLEIDLANVETVLIKCVQGAVYALAVIMDNFEEVFITSFGEESMEVIEEFTKQSTVEPAYWKKIVDHFAISRMAEAYDAIIDQGRYVLGKEGSMLAIRFDFNDVLKGLKKSDKLVQKTRIQASFEATRTQPGNAEVQRLLLELFKGEKPLVEHSSPKEIIHVGRLICMDPVCEQLKKGHDHLLASLRGPATGETIGDDWEAVGYDRRKFVFIRDQALAMAVGAILVNDLARQDFLLAVGHLSPREVKNLGAQFGNFEVESISRAMALLLEYQFLSILEDKAAEDGNKVLIRSVRLRRAPLADVEALFADGMTKLRKNRLWETAESDPGWLVFKVRAAKDLDAAMDVLQMDGTLRKKVRELYETADVQVECLALLNIELIAKTTTNLKQKLTEILGRFGVAKD